MKSVFLVLFLATLAVGCGRREGAPLAASLPPAQVRLASVQAAEIPRLTEATGTIRPVRRALKPLWVLLALVFLFEAWLWEHLRPLVAWVVDLVAWNRLKARVAAAIEHLPPYPTLLVFLVPVILLFPLKLLGLWI